MLVEDVTIPPTARHVAVSLSGPSRLAGKLGLAWPIEDDPERAGDWALVIEGMPSVIYCRRHALVLLDAASRT